MRDLIDILMIFLIVLGIGCNFLVLYVIYTGEIAFLKEQEKKAHQPEKK